MATTKERYDSAVSELIELATVCKTAKLNHDHDDAIVLMSQAERMAYRLNEEFEQLRKELDIEPYIPPQDPEPTLRRLS